MAKIFFALCFALSCVMTANSEMTTADVLQKLEALERRMGELQSENLKIRLQNEKVVSENAQMTEEYEKLKEGVEGSRRLSENDRRLTADLEGALDHMWLIICGALVMLMQAGFAMVEAGCCRVKNVQNILLKNLLDVCLGTLCWWALGWTIAYGFEADKADSQVWAGHLQYFGHEFLESDSDGNQTPTNLPRDWFFQWAFCATASTIVSGGVAERVQFPAYVVYTLCMTTIIYPHVVAWMWSSNGWLTAAVKKDDKHLNQVGFNDFAGSGIVHMTGGIGALVGAIMSGPRKDRFNPDSKENFDPHSLPLVVLGTIILWFGWYGFNCGSTLGMASTAAGHLAAVVAMNTTIAASTGGLVVLILRFVITHVKGAGKYDICGMCNGILAGLVSITAGCGNVESGSAFVIGLIGGIIFQGTSMLLQLLKVDDPIDAFAVHGACGAWGVLAACFFDWGKGFDKYNGFNGGFSNAANLDGETGGLWSAGFAAAIVEILVIIAWVGGLSVIILLPFKLLGMLTVAESIQEQGLDGVKHSPLKAYNDSSAGPQQGQQNFNKVLPVADPDSAVTTKAMMAGQS